MTKSLFLSGLLFLFLLGSASLSAQQVFRTTPTSVIPYLEYVPQDYNSNSSKYPVVFFLHGVGERAPNTNDINILQAEVWDITKNGPPKWVKAGYQFPFILISIQLKNNYSTWPTWYVMEVIEHVKTYLRVDERRIHISGLSLGGGGTWTMAQTFPQLFASVTPICGGYNQPSKACSIAAEDLPVWAFHGDDDPTVSYTKSQIMVNAINNCVPAPNPQAKLTIYPGVKHNAWDKAYYPDHTYHNPNIYDWIMTHTNKINGNNQIPIANAGADKTISTDRTSITATATDDGSIVSFQWAKVSGPACVLTDSDAATLSVTSLSVGKYVFSCKVSDDQGATDTDYVQVVVQQPPVANAGLDVTITVPANSATLSGSAKDPDGTIAGLRWSFVSGPATPTITGATSAAATVSGLNAIGNYVFQLEAKDNYGASDTDEVTVFVKESGNNVLPIANAGADLTITLPANSAVLVGSAKDEDGTISSYQWTFISGPATPTLTGAATASLAVAGLSVSGNYVFQLQAKDNAGGTGTDQVTIIVNPAPVNQLPVASAGADITLTLPNSTTNITGSASDADGTITSYKWTFISGPKVPVIANSTTSTVSLSGLSASGNYVMQFEAKDNLGGVGKDQVTVIVKDAPVNQLPVANAGADKTITLPVNSIAITGSATDSDGAIAGYKWTFVSGPTNPVLTNATTATVTVSGLTAAGSYILQLEVSDNAGATGKDQVTVFVKSAPVNQLPVANAGSDVNLVLPTSSAVISGSATDADGTIASYGWIFVSGPKAPALTNANSASVAVSGMSVAGTYVLQLEVKDNAGAVARDQVSVIVKEAPPNQVPVVSAGADLTITLPTSAATISGSAKDSDGSISSYKWTFVSGPKVPTMANTTSVALSVTGLTSPGTYAFRLDAIDNNGATGSDQVAIIVKPVPVNQLPQANAGPDATITLPVSTTTLTGSGADSDGTVSSYQWTFVSGPKTPSLASPASSNTTVSELTIAGSYVFKLEIKDNAGGIGVDQVTVIVKAANKNPIASAGPDVSITLPTSSVSLSGSGTDSDGTISSFQWTFVSGPRVPTISNDASAKASISGMSASGNYVFKFEVKDNLGAIGSDQVTVVVKAANKPPVANAGPDVKLVLPAMETTLVGGGSDSDGSIASYHWTFVSGPLTPTLADISAASVSVTGLSIVGGYVFQLQVKDNQGATAIDQMTIQVVENVLPLADAGNDITLTWPNSSVDMTGVASDADGTIVSYEWVQVSGPASAEIEDSLTPSPSISGLSAVGLYVFRFTVTDNDGGIASDKVGVSVVAVSSSGQPGFEVDPPSVVDLTEDEDPYWSNKKVYIYNETGGQIYTGSWTQNSFEEILSRGGLFIYQVTENGRKVSSGKIAVRQ